MQSARVVRTVIILCAVVAALAIAAKASGTGNGPNMFGFVNTTGIVRTYKM